jgi:hypothetical protein
MPLSYNAEVWRQMADRARALADRLGNPALKAPIARMAAGFDTLAERVDSLEARRAAKSDRTSQQGKYKPPQRDQSS